MSCPDWSRLADPRREAADATSAPPVDPEGWQEALEHLDGCDRCRSEALEADPVLLFRRLPTVEPSAEAVDDMRAGVAALRRAHRVTGGTEAPPGAQRRAMPLRWWGRAAAAAVLAAALLGLRPDVEEPGWATAPAWETEAPMPMADLERGAASAVDDIEHPTASVYHFENEEVGVVMVVDAGFDV